ncbi:MAG: hypothetical protein ACOC05_06815 [Oceanicaulis sp.]
MFCEKCGDEAEAARSAFEAFATLLGQAGRRAVTLAPPPAQRITADELSFIAAIAAAQAGDVETVAAHLRWLFAGDYPVGAEDAVYRAAAGLYVNGLIVEAPALDRPVTVAAMTARPVNYSGHA